MNQCTKIAVSDVKSYPALGSTNLEKTDIQTGPHHPACKKHNRENTDGYSDWKSRENHGKFGQKMVSAMRAFASRQKDGTMYIEG